MFPRTRVDENDKFIFVRSTADFFSTESVPPISDRDLTAEAQSKDGRLISVPVLTAKDVPALKLSVIANAVSKEIFRGDESLPYTEDKSGGKLN